MVIPDVEGEPSLKTAQTRADIEGALARMGDEDTLELLQKYFGNLPRGKKLNQRIIGMYSDDNGLRSALKRVLNKERTDAPAFEDAHTREDIMWAVYASDCNDEEEHEGVLTQVEATFDAKPGEILTNPIKYITNSDPFAGLQTAIKRVVESEKKISAA